MITAEEARRLVEERAHVRVYSAADPNLLMAEGRVFAYSAYPTLDIKQADGTMSSWQTTLRILEAEEAQAPPREKA